MCCIIYLLVETIIQVYKVTHPTLYIVHTSKYHTKYINMEYNQDQSVSRYVRVVLILDLLSISHDKTAIIIISGHWTVTRCPL